MSILATLRSSLSEEQSSFQIIRISKDKKFLQTSDEQILSVTNVLKSIENGLLEESDDTLTLVKGRSFVNAEGITFFTEKESTRPTF